MYNIGDLRNDILRIAEAIEVERGVIAITEPSFSDDWKRVRHIWTNTVREEQVRIGWVNLLHAEETVKKVVRYCDVTIRQLDEYRNAL
jgi:hypothetical protein